MCGRVADRAVQVFGGSGYMADNVAERFYRDVRLFRLYEGTSQIHQINIAKRTMALAAVPGRPHAFGFHPALSLGPSRPARSMRNAECVKDTTPPPRRGID
jgi:hypothetical protein